MKGLILTYLITATTALGALRYPVIGLYVYVGFAVLRPQEIWGWAGDLSNISLIVGVAMLIGWALQGFGSWSMERGRPIVYGLLFFVLWFAISASLAQNTARSFGSLWELSKLVLPFLVGVTLLDDKNSRPLLWTIVLAQGYVSLEMNMNYLRGYNSAAEGFGGMDNNCFGVSLVAVLGPAMALMLSSKKWYSRLLAATAAALILHTTLLTFSRGAMLGLVAVAAVGFVMMPKRPKYMGAMLLAVLLAVRLTGPQLADRYASTFVASEDRDQSAQSRLEMWKDCLIVIEDQPIFGVGPANWGVIAATYGWPEGKSAHSVWMETAAEVGIPGTLALIAFFGFAAIRLWPMARARQTETNRYEIAVAAGVVLSVVGFAVAGQFVSVPGLEVPYYVVMVGVAMLKSKPRYAVAGATVNVLSRPFSPYHLALPLRQRSAQRL